MDLIKEIHLNWIIENFDNFSAERQEYFLLKLRDLI